MTWVARCADANTPGFLPRWCQRNLFQAELALREMGTRSLLVTLGDGPEAESLCCNEVRAGDAAARKRGQTYFRDEQRGGRAIVF